MTVVPSPSRTITPLPFRSSFSPSLPSPLPSRACQNAPLAIVNTCITASVMGFLYLLGLLYATTDRDR